ncbi:glycerol-3-phosphate dehydrogenase [Massilia sp. JS1662]|nr:glycerol-3-phosphate dehydrogenase [Massilia sp. JS1662]KGF83051.1 glycerol-3-phosphate dehydrogenase [Massilia sp. JS1662]
MGEHGKRIECDVLVVGGGINGAGIARDAAGRGLRVVLCEKDDLAQHTSSASSKLIHGGLRYLEQYHFGLVRKALAEREVLLKSAPHIIRPLRFLMPHAAGQRPAWMIRTGLFLYDHLARRDFLPASSTVALRSHPAGAALQRRFTQAFAYSDAWVDDARLVVLAALDARERGATILTRTRCARARRGATRWEADLEGADGTVHVHARCLVNAAGPWAGSFLQAAGAGPARPLRLVKGSHIVVPRLVDGDQAFLLQQPDGRIVFALPYEGAFTLVGTTDVDYDAQDVDRVAISPAETAYLCDAVNRCFERRVTPDEVVWSYAGVRPLIGDHGGSASSASRDYRFEHDTAGGAPLLSVFGGKVTTFRKLAEQAVDWMGPVLGRHVPAWTAHACLPGGDLYGKEPVARAVLEYDAWVRTRRQQFSWLPEDLLARYARSYGTRLSALLSHCRTRTDLGAEIVPGLYEVEADYLVRQEWATCADDILWRRTKLGLHMAPGAAQRLDAWLTARRHGTVTAR